MSFEKNDQLVFAPTGKQSCPTIGHCRVTLLQKTGDK